MQTIRDKFLKVVLVREDEGAQDLRSQLLHPARHMGAVYWGSASRMASSWAMLKKRSTARHSSGQHWPQ